MSKPPFRNQRARFRNLSPPYAEKTLDNPRGYFPSRKNGRQILFWDLRELKFIGLLEASSVIVGFEERSELLEMRCGPSWYRFVPHFRVMLPGGPVFVELSHHGKPSTGKQEAVAALARAKFAVDRQPFAEISHAEVRALPRQKNAALLIRYLSTTVSERQELQARDVLAGGPAPMRDVEAASDVSHAHLLAMVRRGDLGLATREPITRESRISLPVQGPAR